MRMKIALSAVLLGIGTPAFAGDGTCDADGGNCTATVTAPVNDNPTASFNFFGDVTRLQASSDQVNLSEQKGPLPIAFSANVQSWHGGVPLSNSYTETLQGFYPISQQWTILGQALYQTQGSIDHANILSGVSYRPNDVFSLNIVAGAGIKTLYTYQWATFISPQYQLPIVTGGRKPLSVDLDTSFQHYELGNFSQIIPKLGINVAAWLPQIQIGYAFGGFDNTTSVSVTQYSQPQAVRGVTMLAIFHPLRRMYVIVNYLPANRDYQSGSYVTQNTFSGTLQWNLSNGLRVSFYGQDSWYQTGSDRSLGGGLNFDF